MIIVAATGPTLSSIQETAAALERRGASTITIGGQTAGADLILPDDVPEWLSPDRERNTRAGPRASLGRAQRTADRRAGSLTKITETL